MEEKNTADVHKNTVMYFASNMRDTNNLKILAQTAQILWMQEHRTRGEKKMYKIKDDSIMDDPGG
ncbi:MAG: hypothetical protein HDQ95_13970 [Roseburia sp.]|nr:hypothetical protein [Roseburia sp.]